MPLLIFHNPNICPKGRVLSFFFRIFLCFFGFFILQTSLFFNLTQNENHPKATTSFGHAVNQAIFLFLFLKQLKPATLFGNIKAEKNRAESYGRNKNSRSAQKSH